MSQAATIDTLRFSNRLKEAGLPSAQAEALAHAIDSELNGDTKTGVATLSGEVRVLKWAAGIALAFIFGAFAILYQGQAAIVGVQTDLRERVTRVEERVTQMDAQIVQMDARMTQVEERMAQMEERMAQMEERMTQMEERMAQMEGRMTQMEGRMTQMEERMAQMEERMAQMEGMLRTLVEKQGGTS